MAELANVVRNGSIISQRAWKAYIAGLQRSTHPKNGTKAAIRKKLAQRITEAVGKRIPEKKFGIMFSGGVDSSLIAFVAKKLGGKFVCYSVGTYGSKDIEAAKIAAEKLKLPLKYKIFTLPETERIIKKAAAVVGEPNVVNVGVAAVEIAAAELAKKDKINVFFGGLGSEEIFAGYQRHSEAKDVNRECLAGLRNMWERDFIRDSKVAAAMGISFLVPFLDSDLITAAMEVPAKYKISKSEKKIILRETAAAMGLPREIAFRKKIAAQYGSGFDRAMEKLARKSGFRYKKDYLNSLL